MHYDDDDDDDDDFNHMLFHISRETLIYLNVIKMFVTKNNFFVNDVFMTKTNCQ